MTEKKQRLIAGTINHWPDDDEWQNWHLDVSPRPIWSRELNMSVLPDFVADVASMPDFREDMFDEVRMHHVLEHLSEEGGFAAIRRTIQILKPGGVFDVEVPDMDRVAAAWVEAGPRREGLQQWIYGEQLPHHEPGDSHRFAYTEDFLRKALEGYGFEVGGRLDTGLALRLCSTKPLPAEEVRS